MENQELYEQVDQDPKSGCAIAVILMAVVADLMTVVALMSK